MRRNTDELREVRLEPRYVLDYGGAHLETELFGETYAAPFGVAPIGLQGLVWPGACEFLAEAAHAARVPFILSTVGTASIERVAEITEGKAWFQLYHPTEDDLRDKILDRAEAAGVPVLVLLADTPTFGYRPKEIRNGPRDPPAHVPAQHRPDDDAPDLVLLAAGAGQARVRHPSRPTSPRAWTCPTWGNS